MSYPPPQQPYQPQGGNWAAPPYGGPPQKNRAGLIILLIVVLVAVILGIVGFVAFRFTSGSSNDGGTAPAAPPSTSKPAAPPKTVPSAVPSKAPTKAVPSKPASSQPIPSKPVGGEPTKATAFALAGKFAAALNADNPTAASALACADTKQMFPTLISIWVKAPTSFTVTDAVVGDGPTFLVPISGTTHGQKMGGTVIIEGTCIRVFQLSRSSS